MITSFSQFFVNQSINQCSVVTQTFNFSSGLTQKFNLNCNCVAFKKTTTHSITGIFICGYFICAQILGDNMLLSDTKQHLFLCDFSFAEKLRPGQDLICKGEVTITILCVSS